MGGVNLRQPLRQNLGGEEIIGDEPAHRTGDAFLVARNDCGMRNWNSQRMAEQRHHGKPIRAGAHHTGLGESPHITEPRPVERSKRGGNENRRHGDQQQRRDDPHPPQIGHAVILGGLADGAAPGHRASARSNIHECPVSGRDAIRA